MADERFDLAVIGSGPGGEVGAIRAAQLGLKVALIEKREHLGGTCLNVGCIPTKSLLESAKTWTKICHAEELGFEIGSPKFKWAQIMDRKQQVVDAQRKGLKFLMKKNKITTFHGTGKFVDRQSISVAGGSSGDVTIKAASVLIATGSKVRDLPIAPSDGKMIHTSDTVLSIDHVPKSMAIVGGGVVGMEFASLFGRFGCKVTVIELADQVLPFEDPESVKELCRHLTRKQNVSILTGVKLSQIKTTKNGCVVSLEGADDLKVEKVLLSIGRVPVTEGLGLENVGLETDGRGFLSTDAHYQTKQPGIFAIGDVIDSPALAHTASAESMHAVEVIAGHQPPLIDYEANPSAIYTYPEIASIGKRESTLKELGLDYKTVKFPFAPLAKAKIEEATEGFIKLFISEPHGEILGVHIVGARATELIAEFSLGKILETTIAEIGQTIHPHPTISETIMEAAHAAIGGPIHL